MFGQPFSEGESMSKGNFEADFKKLNIVFLIFQLAVIYSFVLIIVFLLFKSNWAAFITSIIFLISFIFLIIFFWFQFKKDEALGIRKDLIAEPTKIQQKKEELYALILNNKKEINFLNGQFYEYEQKQNVELERKINQINREIQSLPRKFKEERIQKKLEIKNQIIRSHLLNAAVTQAKITGIGENIKSRLQKYGVLSALDVLDSHTLSSIPGIGKIKTMALLEWAKSIRNNALKGQAINLTLADIRKLEQKYGLRKLELNKSIEPITKKTNFIIDEEKVRIDNQINAIQTQNETFQLDYERLNARLKEVETLIVKYQNLTFPKFLIMASQGLFTNNKYVALISTIFLLACLPISQIGVAATTLILSIPTQAITQTMELFNIEKVSPTPSITNSYSQTLTLTPTQSSTPTFTITMTPTISTTPTETHTPTLTGTNTLTSTQTLQPTITPRPTDTRWATPYPGQGASNTPVNYLPTYTNYDCHPSYPDVCIPYPPPDLDCADIPYRNFRVTGPDVHRFDGDNDGWGCEW